MLNHQRPGSFIEVLGCLECQLSDWYFERSAKRDGSQETVVVSKYPKYPEMDPSEAYSVIDIWMGGTLDDCKSQKNPISSSDRMKFL